MAKAGKILIGICLGLFWGCSTKYDEVAPDTELFVEVRDSTGQLLDGADVYIYADPVSFTQTTLTGNPAGFDATVKTVSGIAHLTKLKWDVLYSIYVSFHDLTLFPGTYITLDNADEKYVLKNKLVRGSVSNLEISLKPADGFVTFWTQATNAPAFPIDLFIGTNPGGLLSQSAIIPPLPFQPGGTTVRARKGNKPIEGKSAAGCLWTDQVFIKAAQNVAYLISDCVVGTVAFYTDNTNSPKLPITLKLNANDAIANLSAPVATTPADCAAINLSLAFRIPGDYTYEAISPGGNCVWTGTFTLAANSCNLIFLPTCN